eukprot:8089441-Pyramimonas_sp.AAC.1
MTAATPSRGPKTANSLIDVSGQEVHQPPTDKARAHLACGPVFRSEKRAETHRADEHPYGCGWDITADFASANAMALWDAQ